MGTIGVKIVKWVLYNQMLESFNHPVRAMVPPYLRINFHRSQFHPTTTDSPLENGTGKIQKCRWTRQQSYE